ncbi:PucR family transcriptional regulator [Smaragdicoccus niigatensis]|uniref:PucR family transcriptional regulator n=1 Tax=Smaragdicoccus niigatensis TaxID=359359 RepID=UPI000364E4D1|nr:PucR family transcriptional regulator [Smaragdicoccus niigatensis]
MTDPDFRALDLDAGVIAALLERLPALAEHCVAAVTADVPSYTDAFAGPMGKTIERAVEFSIGGFLRLAALRDQADPSEPVALAVQGAYELGRGEARAGRSMDALLAAYRVGARASWREMSAIAFDHGLSADKMARFADLVFAFIDKLSAASLSGHADELAKTGMVRERYLERLARHLLAGDSVEVVAAAIEHATWTPPETLTAVLLPVARARQALTHLQPSTLQVTEDLPGVDVEQNLAVLLVPDAHDRGREQLLRTLQGRGAVVGPVRPWDGVRTSYLRALRGLALTREEPQHTIDTDRHLVELVLSADNDALADLRRVALAPLTQVREASADRLQETLRSWLLNHGQRDRVAAELFVHPQTVRYRLNQLREVFGDQLDDPQKILELTIALGTAV